VTDTEKDETYRAYWDTIRSRVCSVCLDQADDGTCGLGGRRLCAIRAHLPRLVETLSPIDSPRMDEYVAAVEAEICGRCPQQDAEGECELRDEGECALYTYLSLVVEAVEEVQSAAS
jgi:hypothetical protein